MPLRGPGPFRLERFLPNRLSKTGGQPGDSSPKRRKKTMKTIFSSNLGLLGKVMDLHQERQNVVMSNLANQDVPAFKARTLEFEQELQAALNIDGRGKMTRTQGGHMPTVFNAAGFEGNIDMGWKPRVVQGLDSVDMDKEMSIMAKNTLMYNALTDITKKSFEGLQRVIVDGGK